MKAKCGHCRGTGQVDTQAPHSPPCLKCGGKDLLLRRGDGWYCKKCNAGPYLIGVHGLEQK